MVSACFELTARRAGRGDGVIDKTGNAAGFKGVGHLGEIGHCGTRESVLDRSFH